MNNSTNLILTRTPADFNNPTRKHDRWDVWVGKDLLISGSRDPEHDACRELLRNGINGSAVFWHRGSTDPASKMGIEWGARYTVRETQSGLKRIPYRVFPVTGEARNCKRLPDRYRTAGNEKSASTSETDGGATQ